jgi:chitodextrinase
MTLEAWVNPATVSSAWRDVVYKGDDNYYLMATSSNASRPAAGGIIGGNASAETFGTSTLALNTWAHLATTYDGTTLRLYVNGVQVSSKAQTGTIATSSNPLQIGGDAIYGQYFSGKIDEVRVYNVALTAAQVQGDMATPIGGAPPPDTQAPTTPSGLSATAVGQTQINLSWTASTDNVGVTGYRIERCQGVSCSNFAEIAATSGTGTTFSNTGLTAGTSYSYRVRAQDAVPNLSGYSNTASATTSTAPDTQPPTTPSGLTATAAGTTQINLSWTGSTDNVGVTGYHIERCQGAGCSNFAEIAATSGTGTTFSNTGLTTGTSYSYRVRAQDAVPNLSGYSNTASATTSTQASGLVAAYSFNQGSGTSVADASGSGNTGAIGTAAWTTAGKFGNALSFNGTSAKVTIADAASLRLTTGMTLEAWVSPTTVSSAWRDVIYKGNDNYYLSATTTSSGRPGAGAIFSGSYGETFGTSSLALNTWTHLATTYDGTTLRLYVNGVQVSSKAQTGTMATSTNPLQIGGNAIYGQYFSGKIDEVRVYNGALTQAQVQTDMNTPLP